MSTYTVIRIYCDADTGDEYWEKRCPETFNRSSNTGGLSRAWVVLLAREEGWAVSGGGDVARCPAHRIFKRREGR